MNYRTFSLSAMALGFFAVSAFAFAQQQPDEADERQRPEVEANSDAVTISACLEELNLTQQQQERINEIVREYDAEIASVRKQFSDRYMEMIRTEVMLLTAIEDNLTEAQREQLRAQRRKTAQRQKLSAGTVRKLDESQSGKSQSSKSQSGKSQSGKSQSGKSQSGKSQSGKSQSSKSKPGQSKPGQSTFQPASAVEEGMAIVGVTLTPEQQRTADKLQENYLSQLRSLNREIQGLHMRLVSLEADKCVEIENVLTEEQLLKLRKIRQSASVKRNIQADSGSSSPSSE